MSENIKPMKQKKPQGKVAKIVKTALSAILVVVLAVAMNFANSMLGGNERVVNCVLGSYSNKPIDNSATNTDGLDLQYNKADYIKDTITEAEDKLKMKIASEGVVLLKNDKNFLPLDKSTTYSIFGVNSAKVSVGGGLMGGGSSLKENFDNEGVNINSTLFDFYKSNKCKDFGLASGSIGYGDAEDFRINECPLSTLNEEDGLLDSAKGTTPIFFLKRVAGEGRDMPRSMYNHATSDEDKKKSYLEPDSTEIELLKYLNSNFSDVVLVVNSNAALELGWLKDYPNIHSVIYAPGGLQALPGILDGSINPSGRTVDTFASDALASPAAQNFGDYGYLDESGKFTGYNYVTYKEGIYVGYKYYETRYEDVVLKQGNAGDFNYNKEVVYPFGHGLSYSDFEWSNFKTSWKDDVCTVSVDVKNVGKVAGKDVVEIYAQSPYTPYDKANKVEKASVQLVAYEKTGDIEPGKSETVNLTFKKEQLKSYDSHGAHTYILDAGTYYISAGKNAHDALNNILAAKGSASLVGASDVAAGEPKANLVDTYIPVNAQTDTVTYSKDTKTGIDVEDLFADAAGDATYMTRSDWEGTFPTHDGEVSSEVSTWGNEINGKDGVSYVYGKKASPELLKKLASFDSGSTFDKSQIKNDIVYGAKNNLGVIDMRGLDYNDPLWEDLLDELNPNDYFDTIGVGGYGTMPIASINKPFCVDADTAAGLTWSGTGAMFPNSMTLAQTWNPDLAKEFGEMIGNEAIIGGADGWYAPSMNIHRTPFSGRNGEYYSEDAFLSGTVGSNASYGASSKGMYTFIKHFAFNDQEDHRGDRGGQSSIATWLNEQSAREIYLVPFEMSIKNGEVDLNYIAKNEDGTYKNATRKIPGCMAVMTSFNRVGSTWTGGSYKLLTELLRMEWGFNGLVMTDNANTGVFMDGYQMTEAGGDVKLTSLRDSARYNWDKDDKPTYYYAREAMHHLLYTIANSKAMNGAAPGVVYKYGMSTVSMILTAINVVCVGLILLMVWFTYRRFRRKK